jgi:hypothetical protein
MAGFVGLIMHNQPLLFRTVGFGKVAQVLIVLCIALAKFGILPPNHNRSCVGLAQILPAHIGVNILNPLARFDKVRIKVCHVCQEKGFAVLVLHDVLTLKLIGQN